jgi:hypothetical protein
MVSLRQTVRNTHRSINDGGSYPKFGFLILYTVGRTPWTGDQSVARPLPAHRTAQTQNKLTAIDASSGIRTHDPSVSAGEDSSCLRSRGHCDRPSYSIAPKKKMKVSNTQHPLRIKRGGASASLQHISLLSEPFQPTTVMTVRETFCQDIVFCLTEILKIISNYLY